MPERIDREGVRRLTERGGQLVEVLPAADYAGDHLPGAISLPLRRLEREATEVLDRDRPVIVYCWDSACDLSPRAARRLETLGFDKVYDYVEGKLDWLAAGLPTEGANAEKPRAVDLANRDVPTCDLDDRMGDVTRRAHAAGWDACVVVTADRVVLGLLRSKELAADPELRAEQAMRPGPSTFRPNVPIAEMAEYMTEHKLESSPITSSDGRLIGLLRCSEAVRAAERDDPGAADPPR
jgi:rhodanese-related sulfurtransferase/CBS domain-containing protein